MDLPLTIVAHRGASAEAPENTLRALRRAWECGARWCEVDVQRTADGVPVLVHDDTWERTAGHSGGIRETAWSTVRSLDVGSWFSSDYGGEAVPRLEDALAWTDRLCLNLEIKSPQNDAGLAQSVARAVLDAGAESRTLLSCFEAPVIDALARQHPRLQFGYLGHRPQPQATAGVLRQILEARALLAHPEWMQSGGALEHQEVWAWTVDTLDVAQRLVRRGVRGLITNDPALLLSHFG